MPVGQEPISDGGNRSRLVGGRMLKAVTGIATGVALQATIPAARAQDYELVRPEESYSAELGISVHAQIDVLYVPPGATAPVLVHRTFETRASAVNLSSQYVFEVLNEAALSGVDQALAGGAQTGRISVVAVCYSYGLDGREIQSLAPMGVFINTTDLNVLPEGVASLRTSVKYIPPAER